VAARQYVEASAIKEFIPVSEIQVDRGRPNRDLRGADLKVSILPERAATEGADLESKGALSEQVSRNSLDQNNGQNDERFSHCTPLRFADNNDVFRQRTR
jgi:hypothetical protein